MAGKARRTSRRSSKSAGGLGRHLTTDRIIIGGVALFVVAFLVVIVANSSASQGSAPALNLAAIPDNSQTFPDQGGDHITPGDSHPPYNSNPPTSGWHYADPADVGVYPTALQDEQLVHNLEHGHVWLSYRDADDQAAIDLLSQIQRAYPRHVIVTYRPQNDTRVAAAAWGRLLTLDELDADQLYAFVQRYRAQAPENIPG